MGYQIVTSTPTSKPLPLTGTLNTRDLGGYLAADGKITQTHRCLRSDGLSKITAEDKQYLLAYGVRCVIDLRSSLECEMNPTVLEQEPTIAYTHFPLLDQVNLLISGAAIPESLDALYIGILSQNQDQLKGILEQIAVHDGETVLFNCSAGKDRTGLIAMLLLGVAGVSKRDIVADYALSQGYLADFFTEQKAQMQAFGFDIPESFFSSAPENMENTLNWLDDTYGGIRPYVASLGLPDESIVKLERKLLEEVNE